MPAGGGGTGRRGPWCSCKGRSSIISEKRGGSCMGPTRFSREMGRVVDKEGQNAAAF